MSCDVTLLVVPPLRLGAQELGAVLQNRGSESVEYGAGYRFERQLSSGQWRQLTGVYAQAGVVFTLPPGRSRDVTFGFPMLREDIGGPARAPGRYRIRLPLLCLDEDREDEVSAEFIVSER